MRRLGALVGLCAVALAACSTAPSGDASPAASSPVASASSSAAPSATPSTASSASVSSSASASTSASASASASADESSSSPTPTATKAPGELRTVTTTMAGDLLWHNTVWKSAMRGDGSYDFNPMFAAMKPIIEGVDLAICHSEVPFALDGNAPTGYPMFGAPQPIAPWIKSMGWDACGTASNHSIDQGFKGLVRTYELYQKNGVMPVGTWPTAEARKKANIFTTKHGVKVGLVGGTYSLNGLYLAPEKKWAVSIWDAENLLAQAKLARQSGADIVIVNVHGGNEYQARPTQEQKVLFEKLTASPDVDLVVGEHAHVVQPITKVNGKWVVYGMGNMVAQQSSQMGRTYEGISVRFTFTEKTTGGFEVSKAEYIPTLITRYSGRDTVKVLPVVQSLKEGKGDQARLKLALTETRKSVHLLGKTPGLVEA